MYPYETRKLSFQLVPETAWYCNLRSVLPNWTEISKKVRKPGICAVCGEKTKKLDAHEVWSYNDETHKQLLKEIISVCKACHNAIHIGHASVTGKFVEAIEQYKKVNNLSYDVIRNDYDAACHVWTIRSGYQWNISIDQIKDKVYEQTGIQCDFDEEEGRYYANVPYFLKEQAKKQGAKWNPKKKMWYFSSKEGKEKWLWNIMR